MIRAAALLALTPIAAAAQSPERDIRAMRVASNTAIALHDLAAMDQYAPDFTILPGSLGRPLALAAFRDRMRAAFADPGFVTYLRTPDSIRVARNGKRAGETGHWTGVWRNPDGTMRLTGVYQATWVPTAAGWRLLNESFVTLACSGSRACSEVD